ncbi:hypothetical protein PGB90_007275 [Kerria lacca]
MPIKMQKSNSEDIELLWYNISHFNQTIQFALCCIFIFIFYLAYGYLQEYIFALEGFKQYGWYLTLIQFLYYTIFGWIESKWRNSKRQIPLQTYYILAFLTVGTLGFSNSSLKYLNYPTQVIFKCCKLIPVMIGGIIIQKKQYKFIDYLASSCMCLGLIAFTLSDSQVSPNFNILGVIMISCALICDAVIGNAQEKAMKLYKAPNFEIIFYSYFIGVFYLLIGLSINGDILRGASFCYQFPIVYFQAFLFSVSGYLGVQVVLTLVRTCGALTAVTITTCRKAMSVVISFMFFKKPFTINYIWAGLLIVLGIYLNVLGKNNVNVIDIFKNIRHRGKKKTLLDIV